MILGMHQLSPPRLAALLVLLLVGTLATSSSHGQAVEWIGGTNSDWNTNTNWLNSSPPMVDQFGPLNNVLVGVNNPVTSTTIDLGGTTTVELFTIGPAGGGGTGLTEGKFAAFEFGSVGGETEYTVQNGSVNLASAGDAGAILEAADGLTVNWNVSIAGGGSFYQLNGDTTLNIGAGLTGGNRFAIYNGGPTGSTATVNLDSENYGFERLWLIGSANTAATAFPTSDRNIVVNVNADQTPEEGRTDVYVGATDPGYSASMIIRNGAHMNLTGTIQVGNTGTTAVDAENPATAKAYLQVGDATTTGRLTIDWPSDGLRLGTTVRGTHTTGSEGVLDIVNGEVLLTQNAPVLLGYGRSNGILLGTTGRVILRENGVFRTRANFDERDVATDALGPGRGIMDFDGGTLIVDDGIEAEEASNLIAAGVEVNIMDGGMVLQIGPAVAAVSNSGDFNGDDAVDAADYTVWRDNLGGDEAILPVGSGDGSGTIDAGDYDAWKSAFGNHVGPGVVGSATINAALLGTGSGGLTVQGGGELILTGANTYTGGTVVDESTLSISSAYLADAADVALSANAILDLAFAGTDTINSLLFGGVAQATGTWGAIGSGATHEDARFTGIGLLLVNTSGSGAALLGDSATAVPEPSAFASVILAVAACFGFGRTCRA